MAAEVPGTAERPTQADRAPETESAEKEAAKPVTSERPLDPVSRAERRRRLAEVFGEVLPESTRDDRSDEHPRGGADERWYLENRPPHHEPG